MPDNIRHSRALGTIVAAFVMLACAGLPFIQGGNTRLTGAGSSAVDVEFRTGGANNSVTFGLPNSSLVLSAKFDLIGKKFRDEQSAAYLNRSQLLSGNITNLSQGSDRLFLDPVLSMSSTGPYYSYLGWEGAKATAAGDFNSDGRMDLAVVYSSDSVIGYFPGSITGNFGPLVVLSSNLNYGTDLASGDFNKDGRTDILCVDYSLRYLMVWLQNAIGGMNAPVNYTMAYSAEYVTVGDFNSDGLTDAAVVVYGSSSRYVSVYLQNLSSGAFDPPVNTTFTTSWYYVRGLTCGDLDDDGRDDIVISTEGGYVFYLQQKSTGGFNQYSYWTGSENGGCALGNFGNYYSGNEAVVGFSNATLQGFLVFDFNTTSFQRYYTYGHPNPTSWYFPYAVGVGDMTGDGRADVLVGFFDNFIGNLSVFVQDAGGVLQSPVVYPTGRYQMDLTVADLNGDGKNDVALPMTNPDQTTILWQDNAGVLLNRTNIDFGPSCLTIGDFNGDGRSDIAYSSVYVNRLGLLNQTNQPGIFDSRTMFGSVSDVVAVGAGDFTGDGKDDLLALSRGNDTLALFPQQNGMLRPPSYFPTAYKPCAMATGDVTGDGKTDVLVLTRSDGYLWVFCQTSPGVLGADRSYQVGTDASAIAIGDINLDGRNDVAVTLENSKKVILFLQNASGTLDAHSSYDCGEGPVSVSIGDMDANGLPDIATANIRASSLTGLFQNSPGVFERKNDIPTPAPPQCVRIDDFTDDGSPDLMTHLLDGKLSFGTYDNSGGMRPLGNGTVAPGRCVIAFGNLNADRRTDFAIPHEGQVLAAYQVSSDWGAPMSVRTDWGARLLEQADFDNDGYADLVIMQDSRVGVAFGDRTGVRNVLNLNPQEPNNLVGIAVGDFNSDNFKDIAVAGYDTQRATIFYGQAGGKFSTPSSLSFPTYWLHGGLAAGDVNNDGRDDLVMADNHNNRVGVSYQSATGTMQSPVPLSGFAAGLTDIATGDISGDGRKDIVAISYQNTIYVYTQDGSGGLNSPVPYATSANSNYYQGGGVDIGDVNNDGRADVVLACLNDRVLNVFTQKNDGTLNARVTVNVYYNGGNTPGVEIGDINSDNKAEVVVSNPDRGNLTVYFQDGSGGLYEKIGLGAGNTPMGVEIADFNGDGIPDISAANHNGGNVTIILSQKRRGTLMLPPVIVPSQGGIDNAVVFWNQTVAGPGSQLTVQLSNNSINWTTVNNGTRVNFPSSWSKLLCRVVLESEGTYTPALLSVRLVWNYTCYPANPAVDIGDDSVAEWKLAGKMTGKEAVGGPLVVKAMNDYLNAHRDTPGNVTIPVKLSSSNEGVLAITNISIDYDLPPTVDAPMPTDLSIPEDTSNAELFDLTTLFTDDFDSDTLNLELEEAGNSSIVNVTITGSGMLSVDAETGAVNDNWYGELSLRVRATDSSGLFCLAGPIIVRVTPVNDAPFITSTPDTTCTVGFGWIYRATAHDVENDTLKYVLEKSPAGMAVNSSTGLVTWTPGPDAVNLPDRKVVLRVFDPLARSAPQEFAVTVLPNLPPVIDSVPPGQVYAGDEYTYRVNATDPEKAPLTFSLSRSPANLTINATTGVVSWRPVTAQLGSNDVKLAVSDGLNTAEQAFTVNVVQKPVINRPPVIRNFAPTAATVNTSYRHAVSVVDDDGDAINFTLETRPEGMRIDGTGVIIWTPQPNQVGNHTVVLRVFDSKAAVYQNFTISVKNDFVTPPPPIPKPPVKQDLTAVYSIVGILVAVGVLAGVFIAMRKRKLPSAEPVEAENVAEPEAPAPKPRKPHRPAVPERPAPPEKPVRAATPPPAEKPQMAPAPKPPEPVQPPAEEQEFTP